MKSLVKAPTRRCGIVAKRDGSIIVLFQPKNIGFRNLDGGMFWCADHEDGIYQLEAQQFVEYREVTPVEASDGGKPIIIHPGTY